MSIWHTCSPKAGVGALPGEDGEGGGAGAEGRQGGGADGGQGRVLAGLLAQGQGHAVQVHAALPVGAALALRVQVDLELQLAPLRARSRPQELWAGRGRMQTPAAGDHAHVMACASVLSPDPRPGPTCAGRQQSCPVRDWPPHIGYTLHLFQQHEESAMLRPFQHKSPRLPTVGAQRPAGKPGPRLPSSSPVHLCYAITVQGSRRPAPACPGQAGAPWGTQGPAGKPSRPPPSSRR